MISDFDAGMAASFEGERIIAGEEIESSGEKAIAVVDGVEITQVMAGGLITKEPGFDAYVMPSDMERLKIVFNAKVKLNDRGGYEGRVKSISPIEGGQYKVRIGSATPR
jgi:hypothetical protein